MSDSNAPNPYAVTTLEIGEPIREPIGYLSKWTRWMVYIGLPLMMLGTALAFLEIYAIVYAGPVMFTWGVIMMVLTWRQKPFAWFARACVAFPIFVFLLIFVNSWGPEDARRPIPILIAVFTTATLLLTIGRLLQLRTMAPQHRPETSGGQHQRISLMDQPSD